MTLHDLAFALRGTLNGTWINVPGPGHSSADRSLGFRFDPAAPDGLQVKSLAGDDAALCRTYVKELLSAISSGTVIEPSKFAFNENMDASKKFDAAYHLWQQSIEARGTIVESYLTARGCLTGDWNAVIRFHACCPFGAARAPAMLALVQNVITGEPQGIHRTALADDGSGKRNMPIGMNAKMMLGAARDGAVLLGQAQPHLGIAEGVETALSAEKLFGVPVWAVLSAGGIDRFPIIPRVKRLTIFADNDEAGLRAASNCARRYHKAGVAGEVRFPPTSGEDWNDYLKTQEQYDGQ